jgi:signal transduction histidine kinase/ligand-binding sensor domain-containing protein
MPCADSVVRAEKPKVLRSVSVFLLLSFCALSSAWGVDPNRHISQYAHTAWRLQDGVFSGSPLAIAQTTDGYLWVGTQSGLFRFDGVRFVPWSSKDGTQLPSSIVFSLLGASDGSLWIGTRAGLSHLNNQRLINYPGTQGTVTSILEDRDGTIWITRAAVLNDTAPLCHVIDTIARCYGKADGIPDFGNSRGLFRDSLGNFWIGGDTALVRWKSGSSTAYSPEKLRSNAGMGGVEGIAGDVDGSLWIGMGLPGPGLGLQHFVQGVWKPLVTPEFDSRTLEVETLFMDSHDALWIGTLKQGVYRIFAHKVDHFQASDGLSSNSIYKFLEDREGNLWAATSKGIDKFSDIQTATYSPREGLSTEEVDSVVAGRDGTVWIGGAEALDALRNDRVSSLQAGKGLPGNQVTSLLEDHDGRLWVGIDNTLTIYKDGRFRRIDKPDGSPVGVIVGIAEDVDNNIWVETIGPPRTLICIHDFKVQEQFPAPRMPPARQVAADPAGGIWLGLRTGDVAHYQNDHVETFEYQHVPDSQVQQLLVNSDGSVLGATAFGLIGWRQGKKQTLTTRNGLPCNSVFTLILDKTGALWLFTECGLIQIATAELQKWWERPGVVVKMRVFDEFDGVQPGLAPFQKAARTPDGRLWFANTFALQMIDPSHLYENSLPPLVHVEGLIADRKSYSPNAEQSLPSLTRDVEIDYTALSFVVPQKVRFRYKLEGRDTTWQEPGTRRQAFYSDLAPRSYRFRVIACNNDGVWNEEGATLDFSVAPAWYQTTWFRVLCGASLIFAVWALYQLRVQQVARAISTRFDERLAERTRMARDLHDTFLQTIQGSKLVADDALDPSADPARMRRAIEQLSVWLEQAMQEGRAALNSLRTSSTQRNDLAEAFRRATENGLVPSSAKATFTVIGATRDMHPIVRDEVYRIGYEAIRNACAHSQASRLDVELRYAQDLTVRVCDNGVGIEPSVANQGRDGHFGLRGMRERAGRIGGELTLLTSATTGTEVRVVVPGRIVFRTVTANRFEKLKAILRRISRASSSD